MSIALFGSRVCAAALTIAATWLPSLHASAGSLDEFAISLEQTVSDGVPGPGAGNIELSGNIDRYTFDVAANTRVYFDELSASACTIRWTLTRPDRSTVFSTNALCVTDPGTIMLDQPGTYTIDVSANVGVTGIYSFILWEVNPDDEFAIDFKQPVSDGVPGIGAGNLEEPGSIDRYTFEGNAGEILYFDELAGACSVFWRCIAPDASVLFNNNALCVTDPGVHVLPVTGTYVIECDSSNNGHTGTYSFTIWEVNPTETFPIVMDQVVANGDPGPGAGNIEEPGTMDAYTFSVEPGTQVYFEEIAASTCSLQWRCRAPDQSTLFQNNALCVTDPGAFILEQPGIYTVEVYGTGGATGTYSFRLLEVNPIESFPLTLEQVVSDGVPARGAGNIEEPGAVDEYTFSAVPGTAVFFDELDGNCTIQWKCTAPDDSPVFALQGICTNDPGVFVIDQTGTYTIRALSPGGGTGTYSFVVWEINPPQEFDLTLDQLVSNGLPARGAGNIEEPGAIDRFTLTLPANSIVCFEELSGSCGQVWRCDGPGANPVFASQQFCGASPGKYVLTDAGEYIITVGGTNDTVGGYAMIVHTGRAADVNGDCRVNVSDLLAVISAWGDCVDVDNCPTDIVVDGTTNVSDLLAVISDWG